MSKLLISKVQRTTEAQLFIPLTIINSFPIKFREERPNQSSNNREKAEIAKRPVSE